VDLLHPALLKTHIEAACAEKNAIARALFGAGTDTLDPAKMFDEYAAAAEQVRPFVADTGRLLNQILAGGGSVMFEGAQGTMLDIDHGTYPFVTSSSAAAGGACTGTGVPPTSIDGIIGVSKAYITRVGSGPFPSEDRGEGGARIREAGLEYGSVTGRPRRCGWFDVPLLRYTAAINGFDSLVITKLDVLDELESIPVCTGYRVGALEVAEMPPTVAVIEKLEPVYESVPGWRAATFGVSSYDDLPGKAKDYLAFLESRTGVEVGCISTGPERNQTIVRPGSRFEELVGCASSL